MTKAQKVRSPITAGELGLIAWIWVSLDSRCISLETKQNVYVNALKILPDRYQTLKQMVHK